MRHRQSIPGSTASTSRLRDDTRGGRSSRNPHRTQALSGVGAFNVCDEMACNVSCACDAMRTVIENSHTRHTHTHAYDNTSIRLYCHATISPSCYASILPYCHTAMLPCYHTAMLPYCHTVMLPYCHTAMLPCYHTAMQWRASLGGREGRRAGRTSREHPLLGGKSRTAA